MTKAVVLLSGGQDSTTALFWALQEFESVDCITFYYGQTHEREIECAKTVIEKARTEGYKIDEHVIHKVNFLSSSAMTNESENIVYNDNGLPTSYLPSRNIVFLSMAAGYAYQNNASHLVTGVSQIDYSGYFDCRRETIDSLETTLSLGIFGKKDSLKIITPLIFLSKAETVLLAKELGALPYMKYTNTCYRPTADGKACGKCPACKIRLSGFKEAGIEDPIEYA